MSTRVLPEITPETRPFWTGGAEGKLLIMACDACDHRIHPPQVICPKCWCRSLTPKEASGAGIIYSFTVNHQPWIAGITVPYVIAAIDLVDQPGVRLTANIVDCDPASVVIGKKVHVGFEQQEDVYIPVFRLSVD
jgi:uncharacterized protein